MLGETPLRIERLTRIDGVDFDEALETRRIAELDGLDVPVISPQTMLRNKQTAGRLKDLPNIIEREAWLRTQN